MLSHSLFSFFILIRKLLFLAQDCAWNKDTEFPIDYPPLLINKDSWISLKAVEDNGDRIVKVPEGTSVVVACSGTLITSLGVEVTEGVCSGGGLDIGGQITTILDLACTKRVDDATNHEVESCGDGNIGIKAQIGFNVPGYQFYPIIDVCFDDDNDITLYTQHFVYAANVPASDGNPDRPSFQDDDLFYQTYDPNDCYLTANQDAYATDTLGNASLIDLNSQIYFARGHLSPNADFFTEMEADATFYFSNAVPQWQPYNAGNWVYVEIDTRELSVAHNADLIISTGPLGILGANDVNGNPLDIWICDDILIHDIPIPEAMWKVVYEPSSNNGVALITSNRPYQSVVPNEVCPSFDCNTLGWLSLTQSDLTKGYSYCCTVQDFYAANPNAPDYPDAGLLVQ